MLRNQVEVDGGKVPERGSNVGWLLTDEEDKARLARLDRLGANGVADPRTYRIFRYVVLAIARLFILPVLIGHKRLPWKGGMRFQPKMDLDRLGTDPISESGAIVCFTHGSIWDIPMSGIIWTPMVWVCKPAFCKWRLLAPYFFRNGALPFGRTKDSILTKNPLIPVKLALWRIRRLQMSCYKPEEMLERAEAALNRGALVNIYPEGTRKGDDVVTRAAPGAGILSLRTGKPIVPVLIAGCSKGDPTVRLSWHQRWRRVVVGVVGESINPEDYSDGSERERAFAMMQEWEQRVNQLKPEGRWQLFTTRNSW